MGPGSPLRIVRETVERMWDTLWVDANLATMAPGKPYGAIERGAVAAKDGRIAWVGFAADLPKPRRCLS